MIITQLGRRGLLMAACAVSALGAPSLVLAQDAAAAEERTRDEVIVTATRRDTALQAVAVAVTAVGAEALQNAGVKDIRDLTQLAPSLQVPVSENSGSVTARVRGVGTQGSNPGLESSVGVFVDGVYRARNSVAFGDLGELRAIEVLRGPQGTLFGRNTSAGLINVNTKKPSFEWGATGDATYGNYGLGGIGLGLTGPLVEDKLAGRLYLTARTRDGFVDVSEGTGAPLDDVNDQGYYAIRGQLLYTPTETFDARLIVDYSQRAEACCAAVVWQTDVRPVSTTAIVNKIKPGALKLGRQLESYEGNANRSYDQEIEDGGISLELNWDIGPGKLTSLTAQRNWERLAAADSDYTGADLLYTPRGENAGTAFSTFTQELRYAGNVGKLDYLFGVFYSNEDIDHRVRFKIGTDYQAYIGALLAGTNALNPALNNAALAGVVNSVQGLVGVPAAIRGTLDAGGGQNDNYDQNAESIALFTHNIWDITDDFSLTLGLRYTTEEKTFRADYRTTGNSACRAVERIHGLNPVATAGAAAGAICAPWMRSALDGMDHRQSNTEKEWSGIFSASYKLADNINTYASYSRGYKAGGFNLDRSFSDAAVGGVVTSIVSPFAITPGSGAVQTVRQPDTSFAPETVDAFEIGVKTQWLDRAITANLALFHQTFENFQLNTFTGVSFVVTSIPEVVAQGGELDFVIRTPIDGFTITGGMAYSLTEYSKTLGSGTVPTSFIGQNPNLYYLPGQQLTSSPLWTFGSAFNYERPIFADKMLLKTYLDFRHSTDYNTGSNLDPRKVQSGITLLNSRVAVSTADEKWTLELWGRNLTDKRYAQITFDAPLQGDGPQLIQTTPGTVQPAQYGGAPRPITSQLNAFVGEPLTYGVTLRWNF
jgi:iron complex outermembrane recepter protein